MRYAFLTLAPIALLSTSALSQIENEEIECLYSGADRSSIVAATQGEQGSTDREAALERVRPILESCRARYGWDDRRAVLASQYAAAKIFYEDGIQRLGNFGLNRGFISQLYERLSSEQRASLLEGDLQPLVPTIMQAMAASGVDFSHRTETEMNQLGQHVGESLIGLGMTRNIGAQFAPR